MVERTYYPESKRWPSEGIKFVGKIRAKEKASSFGGYAYWYVSIPKIIVDRYGLLPDDGLEVFIYRKGLPHYPYRPMENGKETGKEITYTFNEHYHTSMAGKTMIIGLNSAYRRCHARDDDPMKVLGGRRNWSDDSIFGVKIKDTVDVYVEGRKNLMGNLCRWSYDIERFERLEKCRLERICPSMDLVDGRYIPRTNPESSGQGPSGMM